MSGPTGEVLTAEQRATDLVNLIRARMRDEFINITVLDDVAAALAAARVAGWEAAKAEAVAVCDGKADAYRASYNNHRRDAMLQRFVGGCEVGADKCADAIRALSPAAGQRAGDDGRSG